MMLVTKRLGIRVVSPALLVLLLLGSGCLTRRPRPATAVPAANLVAPAAPVEYAPAPAQITLLNAEYHFVVLDFRSRVLPPVGTRLVVCRDGGRVGVVRITDPVRARFATADILEGELHVGDEAR